MQQLVAQHRRGLRRAQRARRPAARADRELQPRVRDHGARATSELEAAFRALPTFERESRTTLDAPDAVRHRTRTRSSPSCARPRASCRPTLQDLAELAPDLKALFQRPRPADRRLQGRACPAAEAFLDELRPLLAQLDAAAAPAQPAARRFLGPLQAASSRRSSPTPRRPRRPRRRRATRACTTCARPTRSTPRTSPSIRAGSAPTGPTRTPSRARSRTWPRACCPTRRASAPRARCRRS